MEDADYLFLALAASSSVLCLLLLGVLSFRLRRRHRTLDKNLGLVLSQLALVKRATEELTNDRRFLQDIARRSKALTHPVYGLREIREGQLELGYQQSLLALPGKFPVFYGAWAIDGFMARAIVDRIERYRPATILELGSGSSTALIAATLQSLGMMNTRHIVVDHIEEFLDATTRNVAAQGLGDKTEYWLCPLEDGELGEPPWYGGLIQRLGGLKLDLVLVDGPPGTLHPQARRPALDRLKPYLSEEAVILLDDAGRPEEQETVRVWQESHTDMNVTFWKAGKGHAEIRHATSTSQRAAVGDLTVVKK